MAITNFIHLLPDPDEPIRVQGTVGQTWKVQVLFGENRHACISLTHDQALDLASKLVDEVQAQTQHAEAP